MKMFLKYLLAAGLVPHFAFADITDNRDIAGFDQIKVTGNVAIEVRQSDVYRVTVSSDGDTAEGLETKVRGHRNDRLEITIKGEDDANYRVSVSLPELQSLEIVNANAVIESFSGDQIQLSIAGSGYIETQDASVDALVLEIAGSGEMLIRELMSDSLELNIAGSGDININQVTSDRASVTIAGSGDVSADGMIDALSVFIIGSGDFTGNDLKVESLDGSIAGSGDVDISEVISGGIDSAGGVAEAVGLGFDFDGFFYDEEEIELEVEANRRGDRHSGRYESREDGILESLISLVAVILTLGMPIIVVTLAVVYNYRKKRLHYETLQKFADSDQPIPESVMDSLTPKDAPANNLESGIKLIAVGVGIAAFFFIVGAEKAAAIGCIPGFVGLAKLLIWHLESK